MVTDSDSDVEIDRLHEDDSRQMENAYLGGANNFRFWIYIREKFKKNV